MTRTDAPAATQQHGRFLRDIWRTSETSGYWLLASIASAALLIAGYAFLHPAPPLLWLAAALLGAALLAGARIAGQLRIARRAHNLAMQGAHDGFWSWDPISRRLEVGERLLDILCYAHDFLADTHAWLELVHPDDRAGYNRTVAEHLKGKTPYFYCEYRVRAKSGAYCWIASRGLAQRNEKGIAYLMAGSVSDITERKQREEQIQFLAFHDQLTALPNRVLLAERVGEALRAADAGGHRAAIMFIDLDRFKDINDTLGHEIGDLVLQSVAARLRGVLEADWTLARQGGDEFIVVMPRVADADAALDAGRKFLAAVAAPFQEGEHEFQIGASIGTSLFPDDGREASTLLRNADTAMYEAKATGGSTVRPYARQMNERVQWRVSIENRLRHALERKEFELHYQAQVDIASGRLLGAEALLRWTSDGEAVPPDRFIPVAEESGLIVPIGEWVIETALAEAARWRTRFAHAPRLAVNLSPRQFSGGRVARCVLDNLARYQLPTEAIELEITESLLLQPEGDAIDELRELHARGLRLALDDFGTGYSSLSYLQRLPIDALKIDRSFIRPLGTEAANAIVRAIIAMAHNLGLKVVAEGVETDSQLALLRMLGCDVYQGYLYSKPLPAEIFSERLLRQSA